MRLLISIVNIKELRKIIDVGCDIVDIKNPAEGSLGANHPNIIKKVIQMINGRYEVSGTIGDLPYLPGTASLAALGMAQLGVDYVKAGLYGVRDYGEALKMLRWIVEAVKNGLSKTRVIACAYADYKFINSINPGMLPDIAYEAGADGVLIDLKKKSDKKVFSYIDDETLRRIARRCHNNGLTIALSGSLDIGDVDRLVDLDIDIMGVRRGVCSERSWLRGEIDPEKVRHLYERVKDYR
jgi:hypothetical protein